MKTTLIILTLGLVSFLAITVRVEKRWDDIDRIEAELDNVEEIDQGIQKTELQEYLVTEFEVAGLWKSQHWHDGINLRIEQKGNREYAVTCEAFGDLSAGWIMERTSSRFFYR